MSQFAGLDFSDNEDEQPKVAVKKTAGKDATKKAETKPKDQSAAAAAAAKPVAAKAATAAKPIKAATKSNESAPAVVDTTDVVKDNNRGGQPRGKDSKRSEKRREGEQSDRKRTFDRRSGTGRGKEVSKGGRGPYGAGNVNQEAQEAEKDPNAAEVTVGDEEAGVEEEKAEPEPQDSTMSFDDFLRKREESRSGSALLAPAKATRVVDVQKQFAGLTTKEEAEETYIAGKNSKTVGGSKKDQRSTSKTQVVDVAFRFESTAPVFERRRENDSRGDSRGGRGAGRGPRPQQNNRRSTPSSAFNGGDFPSL